MRETHFSNSFLSGVIHCKQDHLSNSNFSFEMENMFIVYSVVIITLFISNSKACKGSPHKSLPTFRADKIGQIVQLDLNAFEVCDMDRNGLTWKEISSCIVRFAYVHALTMSD